MESGATAPSCAHMNLHSLEFGGLIMLAGWLKCHRLPVPAVVVLQHTRRSHRARLYREWNKAHMYLNPICAAFVHMNMLLCWIGAKLILNYSLKFHSLPSRCCCCCCHLSPRLTCCHSQREAPVVQKMQCFPSPYCLWECRLIKTGRKNKMFLSLNDSWNIQISHRIPKYLYFNG